MKVRWYVFGAQAVVAAGAARQTADIDITTDDVPVLQLRAALAKAGFRVRDDVPGVEDLIEHHRVLPMVHRASGFQLDVVRAGPGLEQDLLARAIHRRVGRAQIPFVSTNDLLMLKVLAGRDKDIEDVRALLRSKSSEIDVRIVRARLRELGKLIDDSSLVAGFDALCREVRGTGKRRAASSRRGDGRMERRAGPRAKPSGVVRAGRPRATQRPGAQTRRRLPYRA